MSQVVGVRFKTAGRIYYFDASGFDLQLNDRVVVETAKGLEMGLVLARAEQPPETAADERLRRVVRLADEADVQRCRELKLKEGDARRTCTEKVRERNLPMKVLSAEYNFDGSRLAFYFRSETRVDFRELVRDLASTFRTRIELRQIGARDETKLLGGLGRCGRPLCCAGHLVEFCTVSIRMAKEQELPLNPSKISGLCGRLLCCLSYESKTYAEAKQRMPKVGEQVATPLGEGVVKATNILKESVAVELPSQAVIEVALRDVRMSSQKAGCEAAAAAQGSPS